MQYPPGYRVLPWAFVIVLVTWVAFESVNRVVAFRDGSLDQLVIRSMRQPQQPDRMIGPTALEEAMRDFTALGGYAILVTATVSFAIFARVELGRGMFRFFLLTIVSGFISGVVAKELVKRERPSLVPHLSHVSGSTSFPSSHAMMSVVVFVTIGLLLAQLSRSQALRHLLVGLPFGVSVLVGASRVCMGVHYPTDVLGGWTFGLLWIWVAFSVRGRFLSGRHVKAE